MAKVKYRVGVIGCGRISPFHGMPVKALDDTKVVACCDIRRRKAREKRDLFRCGKYYLDYKEMLANEDLNVVHICTPHYLHPPMAIDAMKAGCHVVTEKPMAISMADAEKMVDTADSCGVRLGVIFQNRYNAGARLIKNALEFGGLGRIQAARAVLTWYRSNAYYSRTDWKGTWDKEGGGVIIDQAIHTLDLVRWFIDEDIETIDASLANREHPGIEVEDVAEGLIHFRHGVTASFWAMNYHSYDSSVQIELHCRNGVATMEAEEGHVHYYDGREFSAKPNPHEVFDYGGGPSYWGTSHVKQIGDFYESLENGEEPEINGREALKTQQMICGIYEAGRTGKTVVITPPKTKGSGKRNG